MRDRIAKIICALLSIGAILAALYVIYFNDSNVTLHNEVNTSEQEETVINPITRKEKTENCIVLDTLDKNQDLLGIINPAVISDINEETDSKYIYISVTDEGTTLFPEDKEEFQNEINSVQDVILCQLGSGYAKETIDQIELDAIAVVQAIATNQDADENIDFGFQYNANFKSSAFAGQNIARHSKIKDFTNVKEADIKKHFEENGLELVISNISVKQVLSNQESASLLEVTTVVECDVKCDNNEGIYSTLDWVPKVGNTEKISFVIQYEARSYWGSTHEVLIRDIAIL